MDQRDKFGRLRQFSNQFGRNEPISTHQRPRLITGPIDAGVLGDHVNDHRWRRGLISRRAVSSPAAAAQSLRPDGLGAQRVGAALITTARIMGAHAGGQPIQGLIQRLRIRGKQAAMDL